MQAVQQPAPAIAQPAPAARTTSSSTSNSGLHVRVGANIDSGINHTANTTTSATNPAGNSIFSQYAWARWVFGIVYIVIGFPLCFMGLAWWKWNCFPFCGIIGFSVGLTIIDLAAGGAVDNTWMWAGIGVAALLTAGMILIFRFCKHLTGGILGFALGMIAFSFFCVNYRVMTGLAPAWWGYIVLACFAAGGIVFGCLYSKDMIMLATAVFGGWYAICGLGNLSGHFPYPTVGVAGWITWCYIITAVVFCVAGFFFQCAHQAKREKTEVTTTTTHVETSAHVEIHV